MLDLPQNCILIGLSGKAGAGKNFLADWIEASVGDRIEVHKFAFADGVRLELEDIANARPGTMWKKPTPSEIRALLQFWGTHRRRQDERYWIKNMEEDLRKFLTEDPENRSPLMLIITDVRYANEMSWVLNIGGRLFYVQAPDSVRKARLRLSDEEFEEMSNHSSEWVAFSLARAKLGSDHEKLDRCYSFNNDCDHNDLCKTEVSRQVEKILEEVQWT